jgi:uncharacterized RDD family membrane protein YckC
MSAFDDVRAQYKGWKDHEILADMAKANNTTPEAIAQYYGVSLQSGYEEFVYPAVILVAICTCIVFSWIFFRRKSRPSLEQGDSNIPLPFASPWKRAGAILLDFVIVFLAMFVMLLLSDIFFATRFKFQPGIGTALWWIYFAFMESSSKQGTIGKAVFGLKVTGLNGERISFWRATGRHFGKLISSVPLAGGFVMAFFTKRRQALHDLMAGCLVLDTTAQNIFTNSGGGITTQSNAHLAASASVVQDVPTFTGSESTQTNSPSSVSPQISLLVDEDAIYEAIANELETGSTDKGLWTRLFAELDGDEKKTKIAYIKQRAEKLMVAERVRIEQLKLTEAEQKLWDIETYKLKYLPPCPNCSSGHVHLVALYDWQCIDCGHGYFRPVIR